LKIYMILIALLTPVMILAEQASINEVIDFQPGEGQNVGQSPEYFPENIFGLPSSEASETTQAASPEDVLSIGMGGEIIVGFGGEVFDRPGPDFVIFENAFLNPVTQKIFKEPGLVSVSQDGIEYHDFPFDSLTLEGCAGVTPTIGDQDPFDPEVSGGDKFDIGELGLDYIRYIKIKDITPMIYENKDHPYYDPILSGFDLDAVLAYDVNQSTSVAEELDADITISNNQLQVSIGGFSDVQIFDLMGRNVLNKEASGDDRIDLNQLNRGVYFVVINSGKKLVTKKIMID
jgi:hypothetical protein